MTFDPQQLPISSAVAELVQEPGKTRVTFTRLASAYFLEDTHPERERILKALKESLDTGCKAQLTYELPSKHITGLNEP